MKILFFGTPEFAVPSLEKILHSSHEVVGVVTQPDRPKGRFQSPVASPIKELATDRSIPSLQPDQLGSETFLDQVRSWMPDAAAVVAYGKIFPRRLLDLFPKGTINLHASLLPQYRGAAPIQWAILNGDTQTGLTTFMIDEQLDHGPILKQLPISIDPQETAIGLSQRMAPAGSRAAN
jgi:methionyl-tRNA formyltransferase